MWGLGSGVWGEQSCLLHECLLIDILAAVKRTAIPHHATFLGWSRQWG
ncbi:MAG: hypothetical protein IM454_00920 [Microcystis sp. M095S1]|nr:MULTISPECIES: hypothetical protein [unclassified Microcystis]MCA2619354.1 hypothetical protein [Microcystis sp. M099S2]MCA2806987.1 hypothetical protein [Microcystis sp. M095S1]MCA2826868.1 hypothetical protein [Microcystis sp. M088S1]MCA2913901.1 hypothetical protein [Microcystis sp. M022S1]MCA2930379.1 hypothetical protein [Microcystis sp. M018S1]